MDEYVIKNPFTTRLPEGVRDELQEMLIDLFPDDDLKGLNNRMVMEALMGKAAMKIKKTNEARPEDLERIEELEKINSDLEEQSQAIEQGFKIIKEDSEAKAKTNEALEKEVEKLKGLLLDSDEKLQLEQTKPDEIRINLSPIRKRLMEETCKRLTELHKKPITPEMILIDMFYKYTTKQEAELFYPFVLKRRDIENIKKEVRNVGQSDN